MPIRLYGINTPELNSPIEEDRNKAIKAKDFVRASLEDQDYFIVRTYKDKKEKYGRYLGEIITKDLDMEININEELVKRELAVRI